MSHVSTRKSASNDEKDKRQSDNSPVPDMKKKVAAIAEKEKMAAEKQNGGERKDKQPEKSDKNTDKKDNKQNGDKQPDKANKSTEKQNVDKVKEKPGDKKEKAAEKPADKKETEKAKEDSTKVEKSSKTTQEKPKPATDKPATIDKPKATDKPVQNGARQNGHGDAPSTVSGDSDSEDMVIVIDDQENDELFPELTYDDTSDAEAVESQDGFRSMTRRSQAKATRTPETPRPPSDKQADNADTNQGKEKDTPKEATKVLQLKDNPSSASERKLRSTDSPKKQTETAADSPKKPAEGKRDDDIMLDEAENSQDGEARKPDTNFSKSRVKVSPYRRSMRLADQTTSSVNATYTGNNTTMEMDITESSYTELPSASDELSNSTDLNGSHVSTLRSIRGRRSYKPLKELTLRTVTRRPPTMPIIGSEQPSRPTGTVVGRKRKPDEATEATEALEATELHAKRMRLLDKLMSPFRRTVHSSTPLPARRAAPIVGINTDLPLSAPVAASEPFEPEALKNVPTAAQPAAQEVAQPLVNGADDSTKRCVVM